MCNIADVYKIMNGMEKVNKVMIQFLIIEQ